MIKNADNKNSSEEVVEQVIKLKRNRNISEEDRKIYEAADKDESDFWKSFRESESIGCRVVSQGCRVLKKG